MFTVKSERLIIFARYPEPGKAKTRLIPALGTEGAAKLYREMAEHTLVQVQAFLQRNVVDVEIRFAGGTLDLMQRWLGKHWRYHPQGEGDLGERMARSLQEAFQQGMERAVIIGTDCPAVEVAILEKAFQTLHHQDLVIGPATDGGYYLIGQSHLIPELFTEISWSTSKVFTETMRTAQTLGVTIACLPTLSDVDYPEDLPIWEQAKHSQTYPFSSL